MQWWQRGMQALQLPLIYAFLIALLQLLAAPARFWPGLLVCRRPLGRIRTVVFPTASCRRRVMLSPGVMGRDLDARGRCPLRRATSANSPFIGPGRCRSGRVLSASTGQVTGAMLRRGQTEAQSHRCPKSARYRAAHRTVASSNDPLRSRVRVKALLGSTPASAVDDRVAR